MAVPRIVIENARGEALDLSADPRYIPILTGTGPPTATINRAKIATADGTRYNSATVNERNMLLTVYFKQDVSRARRNLYNWIASKGYIKIYHYTEELSVWAEGYIEAVEFDEWSLMQCVQASIVCPQPFWMDLRETYTDGSNVDSLFEFPFAIAEAGVELSSIDQTSSTVVYNRGQVETGVTFELVAKLRSLQPRIYNLSTGQYIGFYVDMFPGERLIVTTTTGHKSVTHISDGVHTNAISTLMEGSSWLQMAVGANEYSYTVDEGQMDLKIYHTNMYQGV